MARDNGLSCILQTLLMKMQEHIPQSMIGRFRKRDIQSFAEHQVGELYNQTLVELPRIFHLN